MNRVDSNDQLRVEPIGPYAGSPAVRAFRPVDLAGHLNNRGATGRADTGAGRFNVWRNSFPAEHLPEPGSTLQVGGVPFTLPPPDPAGDNVRCAGQYVELPAVRCDWVHLLAAAERRTEDTLALHYGGGEGSTGGSTDGSTGGSTGGTVDFEALRISDFWAAPAWFGEREALRTPVMHYPHHVQPGVPALLWAQRVPVTRRFPLVGVRFPRNVAVHVFAITVEAVGPAVRPGEAP